MLNRVWARVRALLRPGGVERDIDDELRYHLERDAELHRKRGVSPVDAERAARDAFGGVEAARDDLRAASGVRFVTEMRQDVRYAIRMLRRDAGLTTVAALTLALVIGGNTAVFTVVNAVLLEPLAFPESDRLVIINERTPVRPEMAVAYPDYLDWTARQSSFEGMGASIVIGGVLTGDGNPERIFGRAIDRTFLTTLATPFHLGRNFTADEDRPGAGGAVILSHALWQRRYGGDSGIIGRSINYNGEPYVVVGVLPAGFDYYGRDNGNNDFFLPLGHLAGASYMRDRDSHPVRVLGRVKRGVSLQQARADLSAIAAALAVEYAATNRSVGVSIRPLLEDYVGETRTTLAVLLAAALLVLTIACANIANLLLARGAARRREMAVRLALGAGRARIVRQLFTESLVLSFIGGAAGFALGVAASSVIRNVAPDSLPRLAEMTIDWRVVAFTTIVTALTGLAFGAAPALQVSGVDVRRFLGDGGRGATSGGRRTREALVIAQVAVSIGLLVAAGLLVRSYRLLLRADPGFVADGVVTMRVRLPDGRYRDRQPVLAALDQVLTRVTALRGVDSASLTTGLPLGRATEERYAIEGEAAPSRDRMPVALTQWVSPTYHRTLAIPVLAGRQFTDLDREGGRDVALVDEEFVRRAFPGAPYGRALGRRVQLAGEAPRWRDIVGVVRHVRQAALDEQPRPEIYAPLTQMDPAWQLEIGRAMDLAIKSGEDPGTIVAAVRSAVQQVDPDAPLSHVRTMDAAIAVSLAPRLFTLTLLAVFAAVAVTLCIVGLYGVMNYAVTQRTREIGVRMALGARPDEVVRLVVDRGARMVGIGIAIGIAGAVAAGRVLQDLLFGIRPVDFVTFAAATIVLTAVAAAASYLPARRATRLDPVAALRSE